MKKLLTISANVFYTIVVVSVLSIAFLFVGTKIDILGYQVKIVQSGSMEPAIKTGGIVVIAPSNTYGVGDVVTYGKDTQSQIPVTHRIVEKAGEGRSVVYRTKGDANQDIDPRAVTQGSIIGKVALSIPYIGYVIQYARTPVGFIILVGIPALIIILDHMADIVFEFHKYRARKRTLARRAQKKQAPSPQAKDARITREEMTKRNVYNHQS